MSDYDIVIVGGGPAGSTTAEYAALSGASVLVLDRRKTIGEPVQCGEFIPDSSEMKVTFPLVPDVDELFHVPDELILRRMDTFRMIAPSGRYWDVKFSGYTTDRAQFDKHLSTKAEKAGAEVRTSTRVIGIDSTDVITENDRISAKVIVGADGPLSTVASSLGFPRNVDMYPAVTCQAEGDFPPIMEMHFGDIAPGAYAWVLPKDKGANVGVGFSPKLSDGKLGEYLDTFKRNRGLNVTTRMAGKFVPSNGPITKTVLDNALLVGDSAGHVMAVNGGGVPIAMMCGRIAGRIAASHALNGTPLKDYEMEWRRQLAKPLQTAVNTKRLATLFMNTSRRTEWAMKFVGARRMGKMIRLRPVFP
ncbi:MAG: geranylgeranyl reductase family protein [Euryarchaeota archaeon]|nr:geranylgeranyl reductase family protein [Euryarchaeota archaeon]